MLPMLLVSAVVGLRIDDVAELPLERAVELATAIGRAIEQDGGGSFVVDDPSWSRCTEADRCLGELRARTGPSLVLLRLYAGLTQIRVDAERPDPSGRSATLDVPLDPSRWPQAVHPLVHALFPELDHRAPAEVLLVAAPPPGPAAEVRALPWVIAGAGVALLMVGVVCGVVSRNARSEVETVEHAPPDIAQLSSTTKTYGLAADLLFGGAGLAALLSGAMLLDVL